MKFYVLKTFTMLWCVVLLLSCKDTKKNETEATAAEAVKEAAVEAVTYTVNTAASTILWTGLKPLEKHTGTINLSNGTATVKDGQLESGTFTIDMNSITVTDLEGNSKAKLEGHLKGLQEKSADHFFNVTKFPSATFEITSLGNKEGKTYLEGNLTIKGIKKNISFPANTTIEGDTMTISTEVFTINRTAWNINYASKSIFTDLGDKFIKDDIELKLEIKATKS